MEKHCGRSTSIVSKKTFIYMTSAVRIIAVYRAIFRFEEVDISLPCLDMEAPNVICRRRTSNISNFIAMLALSRLLDAVQNWEALL